MPSRRLAVATLVPMLLGSLLLAAPPEEIPGKRVPRKLPTQVSYPPELPGGKTFVTATSEMFLEEPPTLLTGVEVAKTPPTVDFLYYPGQSYEGKPWSNWGDSSFAAGKYYSAIGDHLAPQGNAFVFEYDPAKKALRQVADVRKIINLPAGHYTPGKIHSTSSSAAMAGCTSPRIAAPRRRPRTRTTIWGTGSCGPIPKRGKEKSSRTGRSPSTVFPTACSTRSG